tara:strand:- start:5323 stop:5811 length:489 start_codon:yes stop_codon:yes gene_type:complete
MKRSSKKKRRKRKYHKKEDNMKSPLMITLIVLILFIILLVFSVFKGPVEKEEINPVLDEEAIRDRISEQRENREENPSVTINKAISSGDISLCNRDTNCEVSFIFDKAAKSGNTADCNEIEDIGSRNNCKDDVLFSNVIINGDKSLCSQIQNLDVKSSCEAI